MSLPGRAPGPDRTEVALGRGPGGGRPRHGAAERGVPPGAGARCDDHLLHRNPHSLLVALVTTGRLNVAALLALGALVAGAVACGLLVAHAAAGAVLLPVALLAIVVVVSAVRRRELWAVPSR